MNEEDKKRLTLYLGECRHNISEWNEDWDYSARSVVLLPKCSICKIYPVENRDFIIPDDMIALRNEIVKRGEWEEFIFRCKEHLYPLDDYDVYNFTAWLTDPPTFIGLVAEWLNSKV